MSAGREILLIRHAETEWSRQGRHTGRTDLPLTDAGREVAGKMRALLAGRELAAVFTSPLRRARETCERSGLIDLAQERDSLMEWDYGDYEGLTTAEIHQQRPDWSLWRDGCPKGEDASAVGARVNTTIAELLSIEGDVAIFSHGHALRVLGARWAELQPADGARLLLSTGSICTLGFEHGGQAISRWNERVS